jgi:drug/metabolite transporter (DMT)-like permease
LRTQTTLPHGVASDFNVLATNAEHLLLLALAGLLAATRRPGWRVLAGAVTAVYAYIGLASILLPNQPNSWGLIGGVASLAAACAYGITAVVATGRFSTAPHQSRSTSTAQKA